MFCLLTLKITQLHQQDHFQKSSVSVLEDPGRKLLLCYLRQKQV